MRCHAVQTHLIVNAPVLSQKSTQLLPEKSRTRCAVDGVLLLDKPLGLSSNAALGRAKWILKAKKGGHTGTLDPLASGLLPLCFGDATKFSHDALDAYKSYEALVVLGSTTSTGDREGSILQTREVAVERSTVHQVLETFRGDILQIPPMYSALKKAGKPLYEYARAGLTVERAARPVTIQALEWLDEAQCHAAKQCVTLNLRVTCSKGTYIRVLAEDIGEALGCGAHLGALRRTRVAAFSLDTAVTLDALEAMEHPQASLLPIDTLLPHLPRYNLRTDLALRFLQGQRLRLDSAGDVSMPLMQACSRIYDEAGQFLGVGDYSEGLLVPQRVIAMNRI